MIAQPKEFSLERESLLASGVREGKQINKYMQKLDNLYRQFIYPIMPPSDLLVKAEALFKWLWTEKPSRYKPQGNFRLDKVIDAQLNKDNQTVGNCLGLTLLYNCLLNRLGIMAEALYLENAFGIGPHILTLLKIKESLIDVENILSDGFAYKAHLDNPFRTRWGDRELVADIYHSVGNECFSKSELIKALENYEMALRLNPVYEKAHLNRTILFEKMRMIGKAK